MPIEAVTNRAMCLCAFEVTDPAKVLDKQKAAVLFFKQVRAMSNNMLKPIFDGLRKNIVRQQIPIEVLKVDPHELEFTTGERRRKSDETYFDEPSTLSPEERARDPIVGIFPSERYVLQIGRISWDVRVHPTVTACVLERPDRLTKIWIHFEGVPEDPLNMPNEQDTRAFVETTTALSDGVLTELRGAYVAALGELGHKPHGCTRFDNARLRICLADNTDLAFSQLVDALLLSKAKFADIVAGRYGAIAQQGAAQAMGFINNVACQPPALEDMDLVDDGSLSRAAVFCRRPLPELGAENTKDRFVMAGLASSLNMISRKLPTDDAWKKLIHQPDLIRSISAARALSGRIADCAARGFDNQQRRQEEKQRAALANG